MLKNKLRLWFCSWYKPVRYIFFITLSIGVLIPLINLYFIYPSLTKKILIKNTENDAMRAAIHLTPMFKQEYADLTKDSIPPDLINEVKKFQNDFQLIKLNLLSENGEIIYSSDPEDIGKVDDNPYFREIVAKGDTYSEVVKNNTISFEDEAVTTDVVETFVPIISDNTFAGALEIYYDIAPRKQDLNKILLNASVIPFVMMLGGLTLTSLILIQLNKSIIKQKKTENELKVFTEKLQNSNRELENFAHVASHDLQEPLRKVIAFGDRLKSRYSEAIDDKGCDYLERMQNASRRMQILINSLLSFSRVTTKAQPFAPVDLAEVTNEVISDLEARIEQTGGHIEKSDLVTIDADPLQMRQLLQNLIGNALKFAKKDTPPVVKIHGEVIHSNGGNTHSFAHDKKSYQLVVEDNGIGFDEKYADRIFGVFQRLHGRKEYEGAGIGLSICRKIVERHDGKIMVKSSPGEGASFIITLPVKQKRGGKNG